METSLLIVGKSLKLNELFLDYIDLHVKNFLGVPDKKLFIDKSDNNLFLDLQELLKSSQNTLIVASKESFNLVNKVIATLSGDSLELKEETLIPSKATHYSKDSYLLQSPEFCVSVICAKENEELPTIHMNFVRSTKLFSLIGLDEDSTKILLEPLASTYEIKLISSQVVDSWSIIEATALKYGDIDNFLKAVKSLFPNKLIESENVIEHIIQTLIENKKSISVAESCTGGLIASMITSISGSSEVFNGSIVSYSNDIKRSWLGVSKTTLEQFGAVSELCVREMMEGVLNASMSDFALATSGIAGPTGGTAEKPVGTVFVGARAKNGEILVERLLLKGDRSYIQKQSAYHAFRLLLLVGKNYFFKK
jgi:nicotinamide-nucleotide amidase